MPETPDFDQIARSIFRDVDGSEADVVGADVEIAAIAEQLRQVWNARGAADIDKVTTALLGEGCQPDGPGITMLVSGLRRLDR